MDYIFYDKYLKTRKLENAKLFIGKTNNSYLIGPKVSVNFDELSFYKRLISSSIYNKKIYKHCFSRKYLKYVNLYYNQLKDNEVIEVFKNGNMVKHNIISLPGGYYDKK